MLWPDMPLIGSVNSNRDGNCVLDNKPINGTCCQQLTEGLKPSPDLQDPTGQWQEEHGNGPSHCAALSDKSPDSYNSNLTLRPEVGGAEWNVVMAQPRHGDGVGVDVAASRFGDILRVPAWFELQQLY
jgi:hypothetical protein